MKLPKDEFEKLQRQWYEKLKRAGFKDIEMFSDGELVLKSKKPPTRLIHMPEDLRKIRAEYFQLLTQRVHDKNTIFLNAIDKYILSRYVEGAYICQIVKELKKKKTPRDRTTVRVTIRRYEMKWGFKNYTRGQLHLKKLRRQNT